MAESSTQEAPKELMKDEYGKMDSSGVLFTVPEFTLESGITLKQVQQVYKTWGELNKKRNNVIVVCHALTGNASLDTWWGEILGPGKALDTRKYFIFCSNLLGSCYGSTGPASINPETGQRYGTDFPATTIRDCLRLKVLVLQHLGVSEVFCVMGGSMGGFLAIEWPLTVEHPKTRCVISLCSSGRHQPWQIGISECQRQAIYADPLWKDGKYPADAPPISGLGVARMMAMVTYRTHPAYMTKFGRERVTKSEQTYFDVEGYLRSQGEKFFTRGFDAASYVRMTQCMDSHDVARGRGDYYEVLASIKIPVLVASVSSDVLYPVSEQLELVRHIPNAQHHMMESNEGHDGFMLETHKISTLVRGFLLGLADEELLEPSSKL